MRILIAEDDVVSRTILAAMLAKWGYETIAVENGNDAWAIMQREDAPRLALLDWDMPGMDGIEVCKRIRQCQFLNPPYVIILTAKSETTDIVVGLDAGANDYISKPYDKRELQARLSVGRRMVALQMELIEAKNALAHEAMHDPLTGALNRRAVFNGLEKELQRSHRKKSPVSVGLCDIDYFKQINDTYGHQVGDEVLRNLVRVIQCNLRGYDLLGRYGGEEFLVVVPDTAGCAEEGFYERLRTQVASFRTATPIGEVTITVSIGVAGVHNGATVDTILSAADTALYRAKDKGRNRVCYAAV
jgi:two-component system, cell cycle response regulator